jgi:hypothetical protein
VRELPSIPRLSIVIFLGFLCAACNSRSQTVVLANQTTLRPNTPLVLRATDLLRVIGSYNQLCIRPLPPDSLTFRTKHWEMGIRRLDGAVVTVGAALLRADNSSDTLSSDGLSMAIGDDCFTIGPSIHDSLHPPFVAARLTATDSLTFAQISWRSWTGW